MVMNDSLENGQLGKAYSNDLRRKLLEAYDRGEGSLREVAERFEVSSPNAWEGLGAAEANGTGGTGGAAAWTGEPSHGGGGRAVRSWVREQPDLTLLELQERLWKTVRLQVSLARLWQVLGRLKLRLKKIAPRPGTGHPGKSAAAGGVAGSSEQNRSGAAGVSGRERSDHRDDPALWTGGARRAGAGGNSGGTLAHADAFRAFSRLLYSEGYDKGMASAMPEKRFPQGFKPLRPS